MKFSTFELKTSVDVRVLWSTFHCYTINGPIEMDATFARSTNDILKLLKHLQPSIDDEISY